MAIRSLERGDADYVWVLNNDTAVSPHALISLAAKARSDPSFGIIDSTLLYHYRPEHVQVLRGRSFSSWTTRIAPVGCGARPRPRPPQLRKAKWNGNSTTLQAPRCW